MPPELVNLNRKLSSFDEIWAPKVVAALNDYRIKLVKMQGDFVWHTHNDTDEAFLCLEGRLVIEFRDGSRALSPGELCVVPKGVEHRPVATELCAAMLIEPAGVINTGDVQGAGAAGRTAPTEVWL